MTKHDTDDNTDDNTDANTDDSDTERLPYNHSLCNPSDMWKSPTSMHNTYTCIQKFDKWKLMLIYT